MEILMEKFLRIIKQLALNAYGSIKQSLFRNSEDFVTNDINWFIAINFFGEKEDKIG
jgi:hypothetical protein